MLRPRIRLRARPALLLALAFLAAASVARADEGTVPDRSYAPDQVGRIISPDMGPGEPHNQPSIVNGWLMLAGNAIHSLWDISDPFRPVMISRFESPHHDGEAESHSVAFQRTADGRTLAVTISGRGVDLWDLSEATAPELLAALELEGIDYGDNSEAVWGVFWQGDTLYVGGTNTGIHVVDTADVRAPRVVRRVPITDFGGVSAGPLYALGNLLIVGTPKNHAGIATLDITDPHAPALLDFVRPETSSYIGAFFGRHAYLLTPFRAYDVTTDPSDIRLLSSTETPASEYMSFGDGRLLLGSMRPNPGAYEHTLSPTGEPTLVRYIEGRRGFLEGLFTDDQFSLPVGNLVILSDDEIDIGSAIAVRDAARDSVPPTVAYVNPPEGSIGVAPGSRIGLSFTDQIDLRSVTSETVIVRPVRGGPALRGAFGHLQTVLSFSPEAPLEPETTYEILLPAGGVTDLVGNALPEEHRSVFSTGSELRSPPCAIEALPPVELGLPSTLRATDAGPGATYAWQLGDGASAPEGDSTALEHTFAAPGRFPVTLTVRSPDGTRSCTSVQVIYRALTPSAPTRSSSVAVDEARGTVWVVNPDADTVTAIATDTLEVRFEREVGEHPRTLAIGPDGAAWIACEGSDELRILEADGSERAAVRFRWGAAPFGVALSPDALSPDGGRAYLSLSGTGALAVLDASTAEVIREIDLTAARGSAASPRPIPRGLAVTHDGGRVLVTRFLSPANRGELFLVDPEGAAAPEVLPLAPDPAPDTAQGGRGIPNLLSSVALSPDGSRAWLPSSKHNTLRGLFVDGQALNTDNTVRTIVSSVALGPEAGGAAGAERSAEILEERIDIDDHDMASAAAPSPLGDLLFVASQGTNVIDVFDTARGEQVAGFSTGLAPQGLALAGGRLYVQSFLSRTVEVYEIAGLLAGTDARATRIASVPTVGAEPLAPEVLLGKQIFYNADSPQMSLDGYVACASCHPDGAHDGRVWDFTDRGEGLRNTIDLRGRAGLGHGPVHWTANFDEIQDFENDIRLHFGGSGIMSDEDFAAEDRSDPLGAPKAGLSERLDALAAYVASLDRFPRSPYRAPDGSRSEAAEAGRALFESLDCLSCHAGEGLTDSGVGPLHDVGTAGPGSGSRRGGALPGFDTPTLRGLWATAPYLHDGSAPTLREVLDLPGHGDAAGLSDAEKDQLIAFLLELENEALGYAPPTPPPPPPGPEAGCACRMGRAGPRRPQGDPIALALLLGLGLALHARRRRRRAPSSHIRGARSGRC